ncbi:uncharacterized protein PpBr36_05798 [Pyricularia pennisetigena]|uniref:uncharacterized protein n=1 Tax=Pyricularia pennisetigena TaxID=1578925 RepID=UPI0011540A63|nr:uncharacterized protein PpBr36_05798 [Pyricularia pennisetigena]TLS22852.1 hypothetical protein PpBr36_05798 [Pyricularia pennisetigena]
MAILQIWDAIIDEKVLFDSSGIYMIPSRINIGSLGPQTFIVPRLKTCPASLEPPYAHGHTFANVTELQTQVVQPSNEIYAEAFALSEFENTNIGGFENNENEKEFDIADSEDSEEEEGWEDENEYTDDDEYDNNDDGSDGDYEEINEKGNMSRVYGQSQKSTEGWGDSFSELIKLDMDLVNNTQELDGGAEPLRKILTPAASRKSVKRGFAGIEGGENGTQSKKSRKQQK